MQMQKPTIEYILNENSFCNQFTTWKKIIGEKLFIIDPKGDYQSWVKLHSHIKKSIPSKDINDFYVLENFHVLNHCSSPKIDFSARDYLIDQIIIELIMFNKDFIQQEHLDLNELRKILIKETELFHEVINKIFADIYINNTALDKVIEKRSEYIFNNALKSHILWTQIKKEYDVFILKEDLSNNLNNELEGKKPFKI